MPLADEREDIFAFIRGKPLDSLIRVEPCQLPFCICPRIFDPQFPCGIQRQCARKIEMKFPASDAGPPRQCPIGKYIILGAGFIKRASLKHQIDTLFQQRRQQVEGVNLCAAHPPLAGEAFGCATMKRSFLWPHRHKVPSRYAVDRFYGYGRHMPDRFPPTSDAALVNLQCGTLP